MHSPQVAVAAMFVAATVLVVLAVLAERKRGIPTPREPFDREHERVVSENEEA